MACPAVNRGRLHGHVPRMPAESIGDRSDHERDASWTIRFDVDLSTRENSRRESRSF